MHILITAGPTREPIDEVRFITNASSGRMGYAVAAAAAARGHEVTLLSGPVNLDAPAGARVIPFVTVEDLRALLGEWFARCDALVMAAAVGDFTVGGPVLGKLKRSGGAIRLDLLPTPDLLAEAARRRRPGQTIVAFAVEPGDPRQVQQRAMAKLADKSADFIVANTPAAMAAPDSLACILGPDGPVLDWATRPKDDLAREIVDLVERSRE
jgi:phosphopantothenoylcysteine decarboxylase/phosphopantothenate--cysteine ligase